MHNILLYLDAAEQTAEHTMPCLAHLLRNRCTNFLPFDNHRFTPLGLVADLQDARQVIARHGASIHMHMHVTVSEAMQCSAAA